MTPKELRKKFDYWKKQMGINNRPQDELLAWYAVRWTYKQMKKEENLLTEKKHKMNMKETLSCAGVNCPLKKTCFKYQNWLNDDDHILTEVAPGYVNNQCVNYNQTEFYGG